MVPNRAVSQAQAHRTLVNHLWCEQVSELAFECVLGRWLRSRSEVRHSPQFPHHLQFDTSRHCFGQISNMASTAVEKDKDLGHSIFITRSTISESGTRVALSFVLCLSSTSDSSRVFALTTIRIGIPIRSMSAKRGPGPRLRSSSNTSRPRSSSPFWIRTASHPQRDSYCRRWYDTDVER